MNSKKEGWSAHEGYTAVTTVTSSAQAVNICMADDLNDNNSKAVDDMLHNSIGRNEAVARNGKVIIDEDNLFGNGGGGNRRGFC